MIFLCWVIKKRRTLFWSELSLDDLHEQSWGPFQRLGQSGWKVDDVMCVCMCVCVCAREYFCETLTYAHVIISRCMPKLRKRNCNFLHKKSSTFWLLQILGHSNFKSRVHLIWKKIWKINQSIFFFHNTKNSCVWSHVRYEIIHFQSFF